MRVFAAGMMLSGVLMAFAPHSVQNEKQLHIKVKKDQRASRGRQVQMFRDSFDGSPSLLKGQIAEVSNWDKASLIKQSMNFINEHQDMFPGLSSKDVFVDENAFVMEDNLALIKLRVLRHGLIIKDAVIDFRFNNAQLVSVLNRSFSHVETKQSLRSNPADSEAKKHAERYRVIQDQGRYMMIPVDVYLEDADEVPYEVEYYGSDEIERKSTHHFLKVEAPVYERTYYKRDSIRVPLAGLQVQVDSQKTTTSEDGSIQTSGGKNLYFKHLVNDYVSVNRGWGSRVTYNGALKDSIDIAEDADAGNGADRIIAQVMPYVHVRSIVDYAKRFLPNVAWLDKQLSVNVNRWSLFMSCNAYWDGWTINFFIDTNACANTSLISDVVFHEWGHGLDANTGGIEDGAFSEGIGDIMSILMTGSPILGHGFFKDGGAVRRLDTPRIYPQDARGGVHREGLVIGTTFYSLFQELQMAYSQEEAQEIFARFSFLMVAGASRYTDVYEVLLSIDDDDGDLSNKTPNFCMINKVFSKHGLAEKDGSCEE